MIPQWDAGCRIEPPVSLPNARIASPAATAAALPPLLPPRNAFKVPWIPCLLKGGVLRRGTHREFIHIETSPKDRPGSLSVSICW